MGDFQIDNEIDKLVDKFADDLKGRLKKLVIRSEKLVLKQYQGAVMATKKETGGGRNMVSSRSTLSSSPRDRPSSRHGTRPTSSRGGGVQQSKRAPRRENDYQDYSDSGSESQSD